MVQSTHLECFSSYDNSKQKICLELYQAVTQWSLIFCINSELGSFFVEYAYAKYSFLKFIMM
ncbi:hypothetical protein VH98_12815 [Acinetobacter brisouii]|nr:hypothetical protein VH98_12815 [Acinetobacter brisouii]